MICQMTLTLKLQIHRNRCKRLGVGVDICVAVAAAKPNVVLECRGTVITLQLLGWTLVVQTCFNCLNIMLLFTDGIGLLGMQLASN